MASEAFETDPEPLTQSSSSDPCEVGESPNVLAGHILESYTLSEKHVQGPFPPSFATLNDGSTPRCGIKCSTLHHLRPPSHGLRSTLTPVPEAHSLRMYGLSLPPPLNHHSRTSLMCLISCLTVPLLDLDVRAPCSLTDATKTSRQASVCHGA